MLSNEADIFKTDITRVYTNRVHTRKINAQKEYLIDFLLTQIPNKILNIVNNAFQKPLQFKITAATTWNKLSYTHQAV